MQIDWVTLAAQVVNFLLLVWVLKRLLYAPVMRAMAARESGIAARLDDAQRLQQEAQAQTAAYREKAAGLEQAREATLERARAEAQRERQRLVEEARSAVEAQRARWQSDLQREQAELRAALARDLASGVVALARRALHDLAGAELDAQTARAFAAHLGTLQAEERAALARGSRLRVATATAMDASARQQVADALRAAVGGDAEVVWSENPELVFGFDVQADGHRLAWNAGDLLHALETRIRDRLVAGHADRSSA